MSPATSFSRRLCVAAATMAFTVGIVVGILLPVYIPSSLLPPSVHPPPPYQAARNGVGGETRAAWRPAPVSKVRDGSQDVGDVLPARTPAVGASYSSFFPSSSPTPQGSGDGDPNINGASLDAARQLFLADVSSKQPPTDSATLDARQRRLLIALSKRRRDPQRGPTHFRFGDQPTPVDARTSNSSWEPADLSNSIEDLSSRATKSASDRSLPPTFATGNEPQEPAGQTDEGVTNQPYSAKLVTAGWPQITRPFPLRSTAVDEVNRGVLPSAVPGQTDDGDQNDAAAWQNGNSTEFRVVDSLVEDGVYWSARVEGLLPAGFSRQAVREWIEFAGNASVVKVLEGCGRMQNRMLVFGDGTKSCCRYRQNNDQIQGEIFSFYLAQLLGLPSLPPAALGLLHGHERQWQSVRGQLTLAQWNEQKPVVMTRFVDGLTPAYIPRHFRGDGRRLHPIAEDLRDLSASELQELAQWSDLVVFDYLTANLDRVVNNMYNRQWNPDMMAAPAHNLAKVSRTGLLVFLDNESGLLHGYRLLDKYEAYHKAMLDALCVFRRSTAQAVQQLHRSADIGPKLKRALYESQSHMAEWLPLLPEKSVKILRDRLSRVVQQISKCGRIYRNNSNTDNPSLASVAQLVYDNSLTQPSVD